ncbi:unnamed protein product [Pocillopora meandrina]|uniref:Ion transport domain-containing protein n=1 Tax=Pocillopora meandrina TaxID=46732 RepID=A0AAU9WXM0_9CNID|nr:unnamed protein product [Pocillopora meandrina]
MHYAAELGFLDVAKTLVKKCPLLLGLRTAKQVEPEKIRRLLPAELALVADNDEMAAYLIRMMWHERLFSWKADDVRKPQPSFFNLHSIIENPKMKKTVVALLDQMVIPHWTYLPQRKDTYDTDEEEEGIEGAWSTITDDPLSYHFYYHILDGDEGGRPPKITESVEDKQIDNKYFSLKDKSCLLLIAKSKHMEALQHPVVRMLIKTKWNSYGFVFLCLQAAFYVIFLLFLSYSLIHGSTRTDPTQYRGVTDFLCGICEVVTLAMAVFYICEEFNQMRVDGSSYFTDWMTLFDWLGLLLILCIMPLRYTHSKLQWMVASLAFLFNFLRIFEFSCVTRTTGLYTKTLAKIILYDVTKSMTVFVVIFLSFCGAIALSLRYSTENHHFRNLEDVFISGFRALTEQQPMVVEDYSAFNWLSILLMMAYMGTVTVILLNILIAQMSTTYT